MATQRLVNTNFWKDTYIIDLDPTQKLLFLYFLTNPRTTLAGVYEISIREVAFDTGIDKDMVEKILGKFVMDEKMHYERGWLILRNFTRHQRINPSMQRGIERLVADLPEWLRNVVASNSAYFDQQSLKLTEAKSQTGDSLGTDWGQHVTSNLIKSNLIKSNLTVPSDTTAKSKKQKREAERVPTKTITELFAYWHEKIGYEIMGMGNNRACAALVRQHGLDTVKRLIDGVAQSHEDQFAPHIGDFVKLNYKQYELIAWGKRKGKSNIEVIS